MISVIIPSYNSEDTIANCLGSLRTQAFDGDHEVFLVDSSNDQTSSIARCLYPDVKVIHLSNKTDPGTARNIGLDVSQGEIIAFLDSDCTAAKDWLRRIATAHDSIYSVVGGAILNANKENDLVGLAGYMAEFREFLPAGPKREVTHIPTCNISYKRRVFKEYGYFQGQYYPQEDLVFNFNLWKNGERILLDPAIQVSHLHRSSLNTFLAHQNRIGAMTAKVLTIIEMQGASLVRHPALAIPLIPCLPLIKFARTLCAFMKYEPQSLKRSPQVLGIFGLGLFYWLSGFTRAIYQTSRC